MTNLEDAEKKLKLADFLISQSGDEIARGAVQHILLAANIAVSTYLNLNAAISPMLIQSKLEKSEHREVVDFARSYVSLWKLSTSQKPSKIEIGNAYKSVKSFVYWVKQNRGLEINA